VKLWLLSRRDGARRIYDQFVEMLVRAPTESRARQLAYDLVAAQDHSIRRSTCEFDRERQVGAEQLATWQRIANAWLDPNITSATVVNAMGREGVVTTNFKHG